eukprot:m.232511 g.232511  ORF g.232511 m.232511 type:complete len:370 (-) comp18751_c0_seq1:157-1266(-)
MTDTIQNSFDNIVGTEQDKTTCPFFLKTGCCQYADRCKRAHLFPLASKVVLIKHMCWGLIPERLDEDDDDAVLQDDKEIMAKFHEFYDDVLPELQAIGKVTQFKACRNFAPHLRGNVYVQYETEDQAAECVRRMGSRWYAGRKLACELTVVRSWRAAMCGPAEKRDGCPRARNCNFLHCFRNPGYNFRDADRDRFPEQASGPVQPSPQRRSRSRSRSRSPPRRRSRSPARRGRSRSRSRSPARRGRSRSPARRPRSRSRSPRGSSRRRGETTSHRRRSRSRSRSRSPRRRRSRSRSRSPSHRHRDSRRSRSPPRSNDKSQRDKDKDSKTKRDRSPTPSKPPQQAPEAPAAPAASPKAASEPLPAGATEE